MSSFLGFVKKHIIIKNKAILVVMAIIFLYRMTFSVFSFSISRFLVAAIGHDYIWIGLAMAISNGIALAIDIPIGISQKYIPPRYFVLLSVILLLFSDAIFMMSTESYWIIFLAVLFYQLSVEIFFITIVTFVLQLSGKKESAQNLAQTDIVDNSGDILGTALAGVLFTLDRFIHAKNMLILFFLLCAISILLLYIYEFADKHHYNFIEKYLMNLKLSRKLITGAQTISQEIITADTPAAPIAAAPQNVEKPTPEEAAPEEAKEKKSINPSELFAKIGKSMRETFGVFVSLIKNPLSAPLLTWVMLIIVLTTFWNESVSFYEPYFLKSLYKGEESLITENISRYIFEAGMLIAALLIPTFLFEYPLGLLADKWGKYKMIILCTLSSGAGLMAVSLISRTYTLFLIYVILGIAFVGIYPSMVGLLNEEFQKHVSPTPTPEAMKEAAPAAAPSAPPEEEGAEGISAAVVSILMNLGQITAGLIGGLLLTALTFNLIFFLLGFGLILIGIGSGIFIHFFANQAPAAPEAK